MGSLLVPLLVLGVVGHGGSGAAVHGERVVVADPRTGETRAHRLPGGTLCHGPVLAVGDRVVFSGYDGRRSAAMSLPLTLAGAPRSLGPADTVTASAAPGRVWLSRWRHGRRRVALRELDLATNEVVTRTTEVLPRWSGLEAALTSGFVIGRDAWPLASGESRYAWCGPRCRAMQVWSRAGELTFRPPPGVRLLPGDGAFSPDGGRLAVPVTYRGDQRVAVVDLVEGGWTLVPGGRLGGYAAVAWSPLGGWVYFTGGKGDRVLAWAPGMERATRVPVDPGGRVISIATVG